jgi:RHS repeat-associated protein
VRGEGRDGLLDYTFDYDRENLRTSATDSLGHTTTYHLNERLQVVRQVDPLGATTHSEWDRHHRLLSRTDALGRTTRFDHDRNGNLTAVTRPDGSGTAAEYNGLGLPVRVTDPDGAVWLQEYDQRGNLTAVTDPTGATTRRRYDERGNLAEVVDGLGGTGRVECDTAGLPLAVVNPLGEVTRYDRDAFGRISTITDPLGGTTRLRWTIEGRLLSRIGADGAVEHWHYDAEGNLAEHVDAMGHVRRTEYTGFDTPVAQTGANGARLELRYDTELRLVSVTNPQGLVWRYEYDAAGRVLRETDFDGRALTYEYDPAGQLVSRTNGVEESVVFVRDALGRVVEKRAGSERVAYEYDLAGRVVSAATGDSVLTYRRDALGRVLAETVDGRTVHSTYDALGRRVSRKTPTGRESGWDFDANDRPVALRTGDRTVRFSYDAAGREVRRSLGAAVELSQQWDVESRLLGQTLRAGGTGRPLHREFRYRADGNLVGIDDAFGGSRRFELDEVGRVTAVLGATWSERYVYDSAGNVATSAGTTSADELGEREYGGGRLRRAGNVHYEHDGQGRVVLRHTRTLSGARRNWTYTWDAEDRLVALTTPDGTRWRYRYDPLGRRTAKQRLAQVGAEVVEQVTFVWDGTVLAEQIGAGVATTWDYEPDSFRPVSQVERRHSPDDATQEWFDSRFYALVTDHIGTPTEMVDDEGAVVWRARFTVWGAALFGDGIECRLRFPGQYHDAESGLNYNYYRYYDPAVGRYGSTDPLGLLAGPNPYAYVGNPTRQYDPLGLAGCERAKKLANRTSERAQNGNVREAPNYHGRLSRTRELEILSSPDAVYHSTGSGGRFIFLKGEDIVITEGPGSSAGQLVTSYGPSGPRGPSGAAIFGGAPTDPGLPITHSAIVNGTIPTPDGGTLPPAVQMIP